LSKIAKAFGVDWKKMYEANKSTLKSGDPNLVYVGEKLVINDFGGSSSATTATTASTSASTATTVTLKYDANALLYYAYERRKKSMEPGGDLENSEKYGNLALYFQDVRDNKAQDVTKYKLTQADVDKFISEFEKMIAGNTELLNKYIENGKNTTVTNIAGRLEFKTKTSSTVPGDVNGDGVVNASDLAPDQTMDNGGTTAGGEDLDYDADAEGFEEQEPEMDREVNTTRTMEINKSNNPWADFFGNNLQ
jgi:LysM repeat protein